MNAPRALGALVVVVGLLAADAAVAPAQAPPTGSSAVDVPLAATPRPPRIAAWAEALPAIVVASQATTETASLRLYGDDGALDPIACARFEAIAAGDNDPHPLAPRLEQLVFKAAYHFASRRVVVVSAYRQHAGRHTAGEALDFKLDGIRAGTLAAWLRKLPRVGVGIYTHPRTQYVHLDVRDESYHWLDASPPGVTWRERQLRDPKQAARDASWSPEGDLPAVEPSHH